MKLGQERHAHAERRSAVMKTEAGQTKTTKRHEDYARLWVILSFQASMVLVLVGASWLFSLVHQVSWIVCGVLCSCMLLGLALLIPALFKQEEER
jgi:hypothetical protein